MDWESGVSRKRVCMEWIPNKVLLCNTGSRIQYPVITHNGIYKRIYKRVTESLWCTVVINIADQLYL